MAGSTRDLADIMSTTVNHKEVLFQEATLPVDVVILCVTRYVGHLNINCKGGNREQESKGHSGQKKDPNKDNT